MRAYTELYRPTGTPSRRSPTRSSRCRPTRDSKRCSAACTPARKVDTRTPSFRWRTICTLSDFGETNDLFIEHAVELGCEALTGALDDAGLHPSDVDVIFTTTVTGVATPSLDARIALRLGLRPDVRRVPIFGLGCVAGAAGIARMHDYLRGAPDDVAALVSVELCSLMYPAAEPTMPSLVGSALFGDGAAAVVAVGEDRAARDRTSRAGRAGDTQPALSRLAGHDGLGRRRCGLPAGAVRRSARRHRALSRRRRHRLSRRPRSDDRRHRLVGVAPGRPEGARGHQLRPGPRTTMRWSCRGVR